MASSLSTVVAAAKGKDWINVLPVELLEVVFRHASGDDITDRHVARLKQMRVCTRWHKIAGRLVDYYIASMRNLFRLLALFDEYPDLAGNVRGVYLVYCSVGYGPGARRGLQETMRGLKQLCSLAKLVTTVDIALSVPALQLEYMDVTVLGNYAPVLHETLAQLKYLKQVKILLIREDLLSSCWLNIDA